ncbi:hypothetical protein PO878_18470 [Iamia majanohamensis]|uniref:Uncharacterized protein n=1 Tax=Iamia majanohamensis TaxID=467976 RepID=A0AAF0BRD8_9ACTN|nr:hypothetical protein [Iamia majanohamensis]WCO66486.1 hypothetical protein PO878_18470 [Iamia majanohamensis]
MTAAPPAPPRRRLPRRMALLAVVAAAVMVIGACVPSDFVKHTDGNFTWFAPRSWIGSPSQGGLTATNNIGTQVVSLSFAPITCGRGSTQLQSATDYFNGARARIRDSFGFSGWRTLSATTPRQIARDHWRQDMTFSGNGGGTPYRGEANLDIKFTGFGFGCAYIHRIRALPASQLNSQMPRLRATQDSINYFNQPVV